MLYCDKLVRAVLTRELTKFCRPVECDKQSIVNDLYNCRYNSELSCMVCRGWVWASMAGCLFSDVFHSILFHKILDQIILVGLSLETARSLFSMKSFVQIILGYKTMSMFPLTFICMYDIEFVLFRSHDPMKLKEIRESSQGCPLSTLHNELDIGSHTTIWY